MVIPPDSANPAAPVERAMAPESALALAGAVVYKTAPDPEVDPSTVCKITAPDAASDALTPELRLTSPPALEVLAPALICTAAPRLIDVPP